MTTTNTTTPKINPVKAALINKNLDALTIAKQDYEAAQANTDKLKTALDNITAQRSAAIKAKDPKASTTLYQQFIAAQKDYNAALGKSKQLQAIEKRATST
jgi:glutamate-1-semialdehyde aminotransferase